MGKGGFGNSATAAGRLLQDTMMARVKKEFDRDCVAGLVDKIALTRPTLERDFRNDKGDAHSGGFSVGCALRAGSIPELGNHYMRVFTGDYMVKASILQTELEDKIGVLKSLVKEVGELEKEMCGIENSAMGEKAATDEQVEEE
ncbi:OLC1v1024371C1 [Oldenlandia corymbosa var. corymbosa]|uniref:OLC1v1024371C1 n=1 Tax=Oldenlandia corymbosa var. corymbosa TaxID=529605 RepID=A0AAV1C2E5_OLDCO|nr:OLC1v1024371C1 [Oldenlandia corymbosa var. corymbosa]